ncbi:MAG: YceI family protein [Verrucomicrobiota bacterium]
MKNLSLTLFVGLVCTLFVTAPLAQGEAKSYEIDTAHSSIDFKIRHLGISWVRGHFADFSGVVKVDDANPENSSVEMTVQAASINTSNEKRDGHLRDEDYFNVAKYPTLTFKSTAVKKTGDKPYEVTGDFTMLGSTKSITVTLQDSGEIEARGSQRRGGEIEEFKIKRSEYGMTESIGPIGDHVHIYLAFAGIKK